MSKDTFLALLVVKLLYSTRIHGLFLSLTALNLFDGKWRQRMSPLLALSEHYVRTGGCPLFGGKADVVISSYRSDYLPARAP